jgi:TonB-linked SusC/RagA family outer membrane protein
MKKLTSSALVVVLTSAVSMGYAQKVKKDTEKVTEVEEVVLNALGVKVKKEQVASSYSKVGGQALADSGESSMLKGLSGKASGVNIIANSGDPGAGAYIQLRGQNSITGGTQPLFVVDGVPLNADEYDNAESGVTNGSRLNDINPNDIDDVQILKGASASALWGYKARNGVILITTKKGKGDKLSATFKSSLSIDMVNVRPTHQNIFGQGSGGKYAEGNKASWGDYIPNRSGAADVFDTSSIKRFVADDGSVYYPTLQKNSKQTYNDSNYDKVFGNGVTKDTYLSLSGATQGANFFFSLGRLDQTGIVRNTDYIRNTVNFNTEIKLASNTALKTRFAYTNTNSNRVVQGGSLSGVLLGLYRTAVDFDNSDYKGTYYDADNAAKLNAHRAYRNPFGAETNPIYNNPLWTMYEQRSPSTVDALRGGLELTHKFNKWFEVIGRFGVDYSLEKRTTIYPINSAELGGVGKATSLTIENRNLNLDLMATGSGNLTDKLGLFYTIGKNFNDQVFEDRTMGYNNFVVDIRDFKLVSSANANRNTNIIPTKQRVSAGYFTTTLDWDKYLFLTLGGRLETTSAYNPNLKTYFYPQAEFGFDFAKIVKQPYLTLGKLRATYGGVASVPKPHKGYTYYGTAEMFDGWGPSYNASAYGATLALNTEQGNALLRPEVRTEREIGVDLGFFNRSKLSVTYYANQIKDLLITADVNPSSGFQSKYGSFATMSNKGVEVDLSVDVVKTKDWKWEVSGNWFLNRNNVDKLEGTKMVALNGYTGGQSAAVEGHAIGSIWGNGFARDASGKMILDANMFPTADPVAKVIADPNPKWKGGAGTSVRYKNFKVSTLFDASIGGQLWDGTNSVLKNFGKNPETANIVTISAADALVMKNYDGTLVKDYGTGANYKPISVNADGSFTVRGNVHDFGGGKVLLDEAYYTNIGGGFSNVTENHIKPADWVKWRQLSLEYTLSGETINHTLGIKNMTVGLVGRNLWLWTKDKTLGIDPETNLTGGSVGRGLQYFNNPNTKSYMFTVQLNF